MILSCVRRIVFTLLDDCTNHHQPPAFPYQNWDIRVQTIFRRSFNLKNTVPQTHLCTHSSDGSIGHENSRYSACRKMQRTAPRADYSVHESMSNLGNEVPGKSVSAVHGNERTESEYPISGNCAKRNPKNSENRRMPP